MSELDWYFASFILTAVAAVIMWVLAVIVYRNNRREYLNRMLSCTYVALGFWLLSGFSEKILTNPSDAYTLWTFRWAYASSTIGATFFLLFSLALYLERAPGVPTRVSLILAGVSLACISCTPLVVKSASYKDGVLTSSDGPLLSLVSIAILLPCLLSAYLIFKKWSVSTGIDRARTGVILYSIVFFIPIAAISVFVLPALTGHDETTSYAYFAGLIPVGFTAYAVIRLRVLDVRVIVRRTGVFITGMVLLSLPLVLLFALLNTLEISDFVEYGSILLIFVLTLFLSPAILRRIRRASSRFFFSELYDELELLDEVSGCLAAKSEPGVGLLESLSRIVHPLGLERIDVLIPPGAISENCWDFECSLERDGSVLRKVNDNCHFMHWLKDVDRTVVTEELQRWPKDESEAALGKAMADSGFSACLPVVISEKPTGYILVGKKSTGRALTSTDIFFLEKAGERFALFIDNYALSARLIAQLGELEKLYRDLHEAYDFKSEVVQVASHEFRTPITIINGFAVTLRENWRELSEKEKLECLESITGGCKRVMDLTDKFLSVNNMESGRFNVSREPIKVSDLIKDLCAGLSQEDQERLIIEADPEVHLFSDRYHLGVVLSNIVENAVRFSPVDKPVVLRIWRNSVCDYIQVQDFGVGIPTDEREKVFEPFVRLETLTHHSKGMGLGLHIVRLLTSRLGVEVEIESPESGGTTVTLTLRTG